MKILLLFCGNIRNVKILISVFTGIINGKIFQGRFIITDPLNYRYNFFVIRNRVGKKWSGKN